MIMDIPTLKAKAIYHVGTMNEGAKSSFFTDSLEGHCISVSRCPAAWRKIAKLGGNPLWELQRYDNTWGGMDFFLMSLNWTSAR